MESVTNSSDENFMMAITGKSSELKRAANSAQQALFGSNASGPLPVKHPPSGSNGVAEEMRYLSDELYALRRDHAKLQQAVFEAAQIQRRLCAPREFTSGEFEIAGEIFPVRHLSGDFFKVMELGPALGVVLGDIAGKGLTAGIWQAHLMGLIQRSARNQANPSDAVAEVNGELCRDDGAPPLTALFFARIDPSTNELRYCNAGLPAPLLFRANKTLEQLDHGGPMLGAMKTATFQTGCVSLNPGDMLIAYSDGVTECRNLQDDEFEMERLTSASRAVSGASASKALFSLLATVLDFAGSCSPADDLTLLVIRRRDSKAIQQPRSRSKKVSAPHRRPASVSWPKNGAPEGPSSE
jgi:serine phosphatase RsbU (regulator of sigma subunit)